MSTTQNKALAAAQNDYEAAKKEWYRLRGLRRVPGNYLRYCAAVDSAASEVDRCAGRLTRAALRERAERAEEELRQERIAHEAAMESKRSEVAALREALATAEEVGNMMTVCLANTTKQRDQLRAELAEKE